MIRHPRMGLLPLYLKLYDDTRPEVRGAFQPFIEEIVADLRGRMIDVSVAHVCRTADEIALAVAEFKRGGVDLVATLHLAYSPSLNAVAPLKALDCPLLLLDTTMDYSFAPDVAPERIMYNHGIHGVMDLASVLRREGRPFAIVAGHHQRSDVLERTAAMTCAAYAARELRATKALRIGRRFDGMGDFAVDDAVLAGVLGVQVDERGIDCLHPYAERVTRQEVLDEMERDHERYNVVAPEDVHERSVRVGLALRHLLEEGEYGALSVNFLAFDRADGPIDTVPFLEIGKAMARGIGYGGEGDLISAALVGALSRGFGRTTFTEPFCPDWERSAVFLSHMGEINPETVMGAPRVVAKDFPWTPTNAPAAFAGAPAPGPGVLANLAPGPGNSFAVLVSPVEVLDDGDNEDLQDLVRGWVRPDESLEAFLEKYSRCGGTHHSALVLGEHAEAVAAFAAFAGLDYHIV